MRTPPSPVAPSIRLRAVAALTHLYPFLSGCGRVAKSSQLRVLSGRTACDAWASVGHGRVLVPLDDLVGRAAFFVGDLDRRVSRIIERCVRPGDCVLDIGANLGLYTLRLAHLVGPEGEVHAFEPNPPTLGYLRQTLANGPRNVRLHELALGRAHGTASMSTQRGNAGHAVVVAVGGPETVAVRVEPLSDAAVARAIPWADFIKMDVEGFEAEVIAGGLDYLRSARPRAILFEENRKGKTLPDSLRMLSELGFRLYSVADRRFLSLRLVPETAADFYSPGDFLAVNPDRAHELRLPLL